MANDRIDAHQQHPIIRLIHLLIRHQRRVRLKRATIRPPELFDQYSVTMVISHRANGSGSRLHARLTIHHPRLTIQHDTSLRVLSLPIRLQDHRDPTELNRRKDLSPVHRRVRSRDRIHVALDGHAYVFERVDDAHGGSAGGAGSGSVVAPMPGKVVKVLVAVGDVVTAGQPLIVVEAMKMETTLVAEIDGTIATVGADVGAMVDAGAVLVAITPA